MKVILFVTMMLLTASGVFAQIQGDVTDQNVKGIQKAMILATHLNTKLSDTVTTDTRGFYSFKNLKPGKYRIEVKATRFVTAIFETIEVKEGETGDAEDDDLYKGQRLDVMMKPSKNP